MPLLRVVLLFAWLYCLTTFCFGVKFFSMFLARNEMRATLKTLRVYWPRKILPYPRSQSCHTPILLQTNDPMPIILMKVAITKFFTHFNHKPRP